MKAACKATLTEYGMYHINIRLTKHAEKERTCSVNLTG